MLHSTRLATEMVRSPYKLTVSGQLPLSLTYSLDHNTTLGLSTVISPSLQGPPQGGRAPIPALPHQQVLLQEDSNRLQCHQQYHINSYCYRMTAIDYHAISSTTSTSIATGYQQQITVLSAAHINGGLVKIM